MILQIVSDSMGVNWSFQIISALGRGGLADMAGLKIGDRIIKIDKIDVEHKTHKEIVAMIQKSYSITLTVIGAHLDPVNLERDEKARKNGENHIWIKMSKGKRIGIDLETSPHKFVGKFEHLVKNVDPNSVSDSKFKIPHIP